MNRTLETTGAHTSVGISVAALVVLLAGCASPTQASTGTATARAAAASPSLTTTFTPPVRDPAAPRLQPVSTGGTDGADGEACARMGEGETDNLAVGDTPAAHTLPAEATDHLRQIFAASTDVSTATAYREDGGDRIFFCTGFTLRPGLSGAMSAAIAVPATSMIATVAGAGGGYGPGENVVDYYGYASDDVAYVIVTTPDDRQHLAAVAGHVWWAAPVVDEATASRSQEGTWQALDRDGTVLAEGKTQPA